jgi:hypothetical protein
MHSPIKTPKKVRKISQFKDTVFHHDTTSISQSRNYGHAMREL